MEENGRVKPADIIREMGRAAVYQATGRQLIVQGERGIRDQVFYQAAGRVFSRAEDLMRDHLLGEFTDSPDEVRRRSEAIARQLALGSFIAESSQSHLHMSTLLPLIDRRRKVVVS